MFTSYLSLCIHAHANSNKATAAWGHSTSNHMRVQNDNALSEAIRGIHAQMQDFGVVPGGEWFRRAVYGALDGCDAGCETLDPRP
jgi:extradiol dioxygenase family protein